jgi:hypothetical protein
MQVTKDVVIDILIKFLSFRNEGKFVHFLSIIRKSSKSSGGEAPRILNVAIR